MIKTANELEERNELFSKTIDRMVSTNHTLDGQLDPRYELNGAYSKDDIEDIVYGDDYLKKIRLSRYFFEKDGFYKRIILHYATVCAYDGILIPNIDNSEINAKRIEKQYYNTLALVDRLNIKNLLTTFATKVLRDGRYCGIISSDNKKDLNIFDLDPYYCRSRYRSLSGFDILEFNVEYFDQVSNETDEQEKVLNSFPKIVRNYYRAWKKGKKSTPWMMLPEDVGVYFNFYTTSPFFLDVIISSLDYGETVERQIQKELEEIRKIIVQKVPHTSDGEYILTQPEVASMHEGAVQMLRKNKNLSVLTSYTDVDAIVSHTSADNNSTMLTQMKENIFTQAGVSSQLFSSSGSSTLEASIQNDLALMMPLVNNFAIFITRVINGNFYNRRGKDFTYVILPITNYNRKKYIEDTLKLANSGYSFLLPAIATGVSQRDITNLKKLENSVLTLLDDLIPLNSSYTQSNNSSEGGLPPKDPEEKAPKTIINEESLDRQGDGK